jgi:hypothetical protein
VYVSSWLAEHSYARYFLMSISLYFASSLIYLLVITSHCEFLSSYAVVLRKTFPSRIPFTQ